MTKTPMTPTPSPQTSLTPMPSSQTFSTPMLSSQTPPAPTPSPQLSIEELENLVWAHSLSLSCQSILPVSQTRQSPLVGLMTFLEQPQDEFSTAQRQELLQIAFNEQPKENINGTFVEVSIIVLCKVCLYLYVLLIFNRHFWQYFKQAH